MNSVELQIISIIPAHSHGAYTLILANESGDKNLPVLIGTFEAQAIAMEIEGMKSSRPLTHDLFADTLREIGFTVTRVDITDIKEGIFFSTITLDKTGETIIMDSRTSDAIALAAKFKAPIYCSEKVMDEAAYEADETEQGKEEDLPGRVAHEELVPVSKSHTGFGSYSLEELEEMLDEAIRDEDYSRAAKIRDEIARRK